MKTNLFYFLLFLCLALRGVGQSDSVSMQSKTAWILSSNFNIPTVQYLPYTKDAKKLKDASGSVSFFNSIGAGISISKADFKILASKDDTTGYDIKNQVGLQIGFLFSRSGGQTTDINRFAFHTGISILDVQVGIGKEFGNISKDFNRVFYTISYAIPLSKFSKKSSLVFKNNKGGRSKKLSPINKAFTI
jgi:hypothetical protein